MANEIFKANLTAEEMKKFKEDVNRMISDRRPPISKTRAEIERSDEINPRKLHFQKVGRDEQYHLIVFYHAHCKGIDYRTAALARGLNMSPKYLKKDLCDLASPDTALIAKRRYMATLKRKAGGRSIADLTRQEQLLIYDEEMATCPPRLLPIFQAVLDGTSIPPGRKGPNISANSHMGEHIPSRPSDEDPMKYVPIRFYIYWFQAGEDVRWNTRPGISSYPGKIDDPIPAHTTGWHARIETDGKFQLVEVRTSKEAYERAIEKIRRAYGGVKR